MDRHSSFIRVFASFFHTPAFTVVYIRCSIVLSVNYQSPLLFVVHNVDCA